MPDTFDISSLPYSWLVVIVFMAVAFGAAGYIIASRRVKQSFVVFLVRFAIVFLLLILIEAAILSLWPSVHNTMCNLTTRLVGGILGTVGVSESVSGSIITLQDPSLVFRVDAACLGGLLLWAYMALVLAESRVSPKQRLAGILIGLAILLGFNFFRITWSIYLEWQTGVNVHDYFYIFNMIFVLLVWAGWLRTLKPKPTKPAKTTPPEQEIVPAPQND